MLIDKRSKRRGGVLCVGRRVRSRRRRRMGQREKEGRKREEERNEREIVGLLC